MTHPSDARVVSRTIDADPDTVYAFASDMEKLPLWASGLASGIRQENQRWIADSPMGRIEVAMTPRNAFRVLDHDVTLPDGQVVHNAMRVTPAGLGQGTAKGSVVSFVLLRQPGMSDDDYERDAAHIATDLATLKDLVERDSA